MVSVVQAKEKLSFDALNKAFSCDFKRIAKNIVGNEPEYPLCVLSWVNKNRTTAGYGYLKSFEIDLVSNCQKMTKQTEKVCKGALEKEIEQIKIRLNKQLHISNRQDRQLSLQILLASVLTTNAKAEPNSKSEYSDSEREFVTDLINYFELISSPKEMRNTNLQDYLKNRIIQRLG